MAGIDLEVKRSRSWLQLGSSAVGMDLHVDTTEHFCSFFICLHDGACLDKADKKAQKEKRDKEEQLRMVRRSPLPSIDIHCDSETELLHLEMTQRTRNVYQSPA